MDSLDCSCGKFPEVWYENRWVLVGCKSCGVAAAAYENLKQAIVDWNNIQKFVPKTLTTKGLGCKIDVNK